MTGNPPHRGEMHPDGDELLFVISGRIDVILEDGGDRAHTSASSASRRCTPARRSSCRRACGIGWTCASRAAWCTSRPGPATVIVHSERDVVDAETTRRCPTSTRRTRSAPAAAASFAAAGHALLPGAGERGRGRRVPRHLEAAAASTNRERRPISERDTYSAAFLQSFNLWRIERGVPPVRVLAPLREGGGRPARCERRAHLPRSGVVQGAGRRPHALAPGPVLLAVRHREDDHDVDAARRSRSAGRFDDVRDRQPHGRASCAGTPSPTRARRSSRAWFAPRAFPSTPTVRSAPATRRFTRAGRCTAPARIPTEHMRPVMTVIYFADGARVSEPDSVYQQFDLGVWLPGLQPGDVAATRRTRCSGRRTADRAQRSASIIASAMNRP